MRRGGRESARVSWGVDHRLWPFLVSSYLDFPAATRLSGVRARTSDFIGAL